MLQTYRETTLSANAAFGENSVDYLVGMMNLINKSCQHEGCTKGASFGKREDNIRSWCSDHKMPGQSSAPHCNQSNSKHIFAAEVPLLYPLRPAMVHQVAYAEEYWYQVVSIGPRKITIAEIGYVADTRYEDKMEP